MNAAMRLRHPGETTAASADEHDSSEQKLIDVRDAHREEPEVKHEAAIQQCGASDEEVDR